MSHKLIIKDLEDAIAKATVQLASSGGAASGSTQSSTAAGAGVAGARTHSNAEQDNKVVTGLTDVTKNIDSDIGIPEAWSANVKRTYDIHQSYDMESQTQNRTQYNVLQSQLQTHLANVNQLALQSLANNQNQSNLCNTLSIDRAWNVNETDAFAVLLNGMVADAVKAAVAKE